MYLAVVLDLFSRRVVGWSMSERIDTKLVLGALEMALEGRTPPQGLRLHHLAPSPLDALRVHQGLLQPTPAALEPGLPEPHEV